MDGTRRVGDPRLPDPAARRWAVPVDPRRPRWAGLGLRRLLAGPFLGFLRSRGYAVLSRTRAARGAGAGTSRRGSSATWAAPTRWTCSPGSITLSEMGIADPQRDRRDRRQLRRVHGGAAPVPRPSLRRGRRDRPGHRLVLRAVRQQPGVRGPQEFLGGDAVARARALPRAEPGLRRRMEPNPDAPHGRGARPSDADGAGGGVPSRAARARRADGRGRLSVRGPRRSRRCPRASTSRPGRSRGSSASCRRTRPLDSLGP